MHTHTSEHSPCSKVSAVDLVKAANAKGLGGLILTDHHYLWSNEEIQELRLAAGVPMSFVISSGQEVTTSDMGDVLVYGARESIGQSIGLAALRREFSGAAIVWAHPWRGQRRPSMIELFDANFDAIEVLNRHHYFSQNRRALRQWLTFGFVAIAGTDSHDHNVGIYPTAFPDEVNTLSGVVESIKSGTCQPFLKGRRYRHSTS